MASLGSARPKVLLVANTAWYLYNFRRPLAKSLLAIGIEPVFVSPPGTHAQILENEGFRWIEFRLDRSGINPLREISTLFALYRIYRNEKPLLVHHFTIKCVLLGTVCSFLARIPGTVNAITGIGHFLIGETKRSKILRPFILILYIFLMHLPKVRLIFQNPDDLRVFKELKIASNHNSFLVRSSGVDLQHFKPHRSSSTLPLVVLFGGRLLVEKGIREFMEAASILIQRGLEVRFHVAGERDPGNPSCITETELNQWKANSWVRFLGHQDQMQPVLSAADLVVLPSYREGVPKILLEAAAMEKPIVSTDVPGCREIVEDGINGTLVPVKNSLALANAIEVLLLNENTRREMGKAGRLKVSREFDDQVVAQKTITVYRSFVSF